MFLGRVPTKITENYQGTNRDSPNSALIPLDAGAQSERELTASWI